MRDLEFLTDHVTFKLCYNQIQLLKTTQKTKNVMNRTLEAFFSLLRNQNKYLYVIFRGIRQEHSLYKKFVKYKAIGLVQYYKRSISILKSSSILILALHYQNFSKKSIPFFQVQIGSPQISGLIHPEHIGNIIHSKIIIADK